MSIEEIWLQSTTGGYINRSIWFIHPSDDRPAAAIIRDEYFAYNPNEEFTLCIHGLGDLEQINNGGIWRLPTGGVQIEVFGPEFDIEAKSGYSAYTKKFEPYLKVVFNQKKYMRSTWVVVGIDDNKSVPIEKIGNDIYIDNKIRVIIPDSPQDRLTVNITDLSIGEKVPFEFYGEILIESNGSSPFIAGSQIYNLTTEREIPNDYGKIPSETFEITHIGSTQNIQKIVSENTTYEVEHAFERYFTPLAELSQIEAALSNLPITGPWILFDDKNRTGLLAKTQIQDNSVIPLLANKINSSAESAWNYDFSGDDINTLKGRPKKALDLAFHAWLYQNATEANRVVELMSDMEQHELRIDEDYKMLHHGYYLHYYTLAWDFIEKMISAEDNATIAEEIRNYANFVNDYLPRCGTNNWELVVSSGVGLAGLKLHNAQMIRNALQKQDHYLRENIRIEGAFYEGQNYGGYSYDSYKMFLIACALHEKEGLPNYFKDDRFKEIFRFYARSITPDGYYPLFEDAGISIQPATNGFILAPFFKRAGDEQLAKEIMWVYDHHDINNTGRHIQKFLFADPYIERSIPILPPKFDNSSYNGSSYVALDSGLAMFRNNWSSNAAYLTANAKTYEQSHVNWDELCFEFFSNGHKLISMSGYPGWGNDYHQNWTVTTEAANGGVLFSGQGQTHEYSKTGIKQWLRGSETDYVEMIGDGIYDPAHNFLTGGEYLWAIPVGMSVGALVVVIMILIWKKLLSIEREELFFNK